MKHFLLIGFLLSVLGTEAQTKRIAHRAHGGSHHERYDGSDDNYGNVRPRKVKVHLESGRDTMVDPWDSLARPYYLDTIPQMGFLMPVEIENISELGRICSKTILP